MTKPLSLDLRQWVIAAIEAGMSCRAAAERFPTLRPGGIVIMDTRSRAKRYRYAAEHLISCARLARDIPDFGTFEAHDADVARLKEEHGRKFGFWSLTAA